MAPLVPLLLSGLTALPQLWDKVAGIFGKEVPQSVAQAGALAGEVQELLDSGKATPEQLLAVEQLASQERQAIRDHHYRMERLVVDDLASQRDAEKAAYASGDEYVARTRPQILREMWRTCQAFVLLAPVVILVARWLGIQGEAMTELVGVIQWVGGWLFGTFGAAFLGYAAARTVDKRNPQAMDGGGALGRAVRLGLAVGGR